MEIKSIIKRIHIKQVVNSFIIIVFFLLPLLASTTQLIPRANYLELIYKLAFGLLLLLFFAIILTKSKTNIPISILAFEVIYFIIGLFAILLCEQDLLIKYLCLLSLFGSIALLNLAFLSRRILSNKVLFVLGVIYIAFVTISCLYSDIAEAGSIVNSIGADGEEAHFFQIHSFFENKNSYGFILFIGIIDACILSIFQKKLRPYLSLFICFFFINLFFSRCKIAIVLSLAIIVFFLVYFLMNLKSKKRNLFIPCLTLIVVLATTVLLIVFVPAIYKTSIFLSKINNYVTEAFFGQAYRSVISRLNQFNSIAPLFMNPRILVGYGERVFDVTLNGTNYIISIDNMYASILITGGVPKTVLFLAVLLFITWSIFRLKKTSKILFNIFMLILICFILYGIFEGHSFIGTSFYSLVWVFLLVTLPISLSQKHNTSGQFRVLHVTGSFLKGGTESFILNYVEEIKKHQNVMFDVYCFGNADSDQISRLKKLKANIFFGAAPSAKKIIISALNFLMFLYSSNDYDVIHCSANFDNLVYLHCGNILNIPVRVEHAHDTLTGINISKKQLIINYFKRILNKYNSNKHFACSVEAGNDIIGPKFFKKHGVVIPNSINYQRFTCKDIKRVKEIKSKYNLSGKKVFGNISRFENKKNQQFIVSLFERYHKTNSNSTLILAGVDGGTFNFIKSYVMKSDFSQSVILLGPISDVENWLAVIDIYIMPSLYEGLGISAIEAQLSGCYVLASTNLPQSVDIGSGRIKFLLLENVDPWIYEMGKENHCDNLDLSKSKYNIANDYDILLKEYGFYKIDYDN